MKNLLSALSLALGLGFATAQTTTPRQTTPVTPVKKEVKSSVKEVKSTAKDTKTTAVKEVKTTSKDAKGTVKEVKSTTTTQGVKLKKDGTPDKRYKSSQHLKKDGTPDMRYKENKK
ncbi:MULTISPECIES: hypothetical protein [Elizabethkingia]|uniref:Uncharacterized protein n=1 Tax=Elizabethkingia anophelis TaxID=1117645 RepID=A0AAU8UUS1_9FLAO|nr:MULTISPECIES: hypothetical protein [Elizabethkingia]AQW94135.1 hypothetical protein BBD30_07950 [Elizabethkingia anophelis]AQX01102.1 hypothetical protein BBD32_06345 [Elizabethkingia anophelis]KFC36270.1 hypothetical protein FF18_02495 [Elizabethkingia anophelis]KUF44632.1 hypothetical protein AS358_08755 [Elizabethkingia anophelis]MCL1033770.1 hypothetical protein [Elizabethkingia anophelis]